jgi:hypothetical protein
VPYTDVDWVWISNHYDIHLTGLARHDGELMRFKTPQFYWAARRTRPIMVRLFRLSPVEKLRAHLNKWAFEVCVGRHWTYPYRQQGKSFRYRRPQWFGKFLYDLYYLTRSS